MPLMYYDPTTKQLTPIADEDTVVSLRNSKTLTNQVYTAVAPNTTSTPATFDSAAGYAALSVILIAASVAEVHVQWSFDGTNVDAEEVLFYLDGDRVPKTVHVSAPYFRIIAINRSTANQDITIKRYLVA